MVANRASNASSYAAWVVASPALYTPMLTA